MARINNQAQNGRSLDLNYPLEGIYSPYSLQVESVVLKGLRIHISLQAQHVDVPTEILIGNNTYMQKYSPAAAYLPFYKMPTSTISAGWDLLMHKTLKREWESLVLESFLQPKPRLL